MTSQPPVVPAALESQPVIPAYPMAPVAPSNGVAITSMVLGIIGAVVGFWAIVPVAGYISAALGFIPALVAVICGHLGHSRAKRLGGTGRRHAIAGIVLGYASIALMAIASFVWTVILFVGI